MSNTVRGAGRAKYAASQAKHSQRTPLPPRSGAVIEKSARTSAMQEAVAAQQATSKPLARPSLGKATQFYLKAEELGWTTTAKTKSGDEKRVVVERGDERIDIAWRSEVFVPDATYVLVPGQARRLKNAAEAYRLLARSVEDAVAAASAPSAPKKAPASATAKRRPRRMPFDPKTATDAEVLAGVLDRKVTWYNSMTEAWESGFVATTKSVRGQGQVPMRTEPTISFARDEDGGVPRRVLNFVDPHCGFRALFVDAIEQVV